MSIVNCAGCNRVMGTIIGKLLKGYVILCAQCEKKRKAAEWAVESARSEMPDFLKGLFK